MQSKNHDIKSAYINSRIVQGATRDEAQEELKTVKNWYQRISVVLGVDYQETTGHGWDNSDIRNKTYNYLESLEEYKCSPQIINAAFKEIRGKNAVEIEEISNNRAERIKVELESGKSAKKVFNEVYNLDGHKQKPVRPENERSDEATRSAHKSAVKSLRSLGIKFKGDSDERGGEPAPQETAEKLKTPFRKAVETFEANGVSFVGRVGSAKKLNLERKVFTGDGAYQTAVKRQRDEEKEGNKEHRNKSARC